MPAVHADLSIEARWIVPMTTPGRVLENHSLVVRDGRILDLCPSSTAAQRYSATVVMQRPTHLLMPGMINAHTHAARSLFRGCSAPTAGLEQRFLSAELVRDGALAAIAEMLQSGITCFGDRYYFPEQTARAAVEQGMRAVIGMPVAETPSAWANGTADYLTEGLRVRDEYKGHPLIYTAFAPQAANRLSDATFARIATLADELDAGIVIDLHESRTEIAESLAQHGMRPIERLWKLGLLTPALTAVYMASVSHEDMELARRSGISISLCPQSSLKRGFGLPPIKEFAASGIRLSLGSGGSEAHPHQTTWDEMRLLALASHSGTDSPEPISRGDVGSPESALPADVVSSTAAAARADSSRHAVSAPLSAWDILAIATRGGAAALGLDADVGTLDAEKWADLCCVDLSGPATQPGGDPVTQVVFRGGRDLVSDVWVAGRQLVCDGELTRLDWTGVAARADAWAQRLTSGG